MSFCLIEREVASCELLAQHLRGFRSEAAFRRKLQEFLVAERPIVFVELHHVGYRVDPIIEPAECLSRRAEVSSGWSAIRKLHHHDAASCLSNA